MYVADFPSPQVGLWDVINQRCHQVIRVAMPEEAAMPGAALTPDALKPNSSSSNATAAAASAAAHSSAAWQANYGGATPQDPYGIEAINAPTPRTTSCSCLLPSSSGALITAGEALQMSGMSVIIMGL